MALFTSLETQWNVALGMGGGQRVGLRYEVLYPLLDRAAAGDESEWNRLFSEMRHMERTVLDIKAAK